MKFRFHVISLPHTQTTKDYNACAYTQKVIKFCRMMKLLGHEVYLYASEDNDAPCDELITIVTKKEQREWFKGYNFRLQLPNALVWNPSLAYWSIPNTRAVAEIKARAKPRDFVCIIGGDCQRQIAQGLPDLMSVEYGIGYRGVFSPYKVFESYAHMHWVYGLSGDDTGHAFDSVIPNYFDPADFPYKAKKDDFFLFIGRLVERKGLEMAVEATSRIGAKLVLAGQGVKDIKGNKIIADEITIQSDHVKHMGHANSRQRGELMSRAKAVFATTTYLEPFGGVAIEAMLCGTPVIATDWGAFPENIINGQVGYRARTLAEAVWAAKNLDKLKPARTIRKYAIDNFSLDRVKYLYQAYFEQLYTLWDENGWYSNWHKGVSKYHRYDRYYPK